MRILTSFAIALLLVVSYGLYQLKYSVETLRERAVALDRQIAVDEDSIDVLQAEWALLTRPQRLQKLSGRFLDLTPMQPEQIAMLPDLIGKTPAALPFDVPVRRAQFNRNVLLDPGHHKVADVRLPTLDMRGENRQ